MLKEGVADIDLQALMEGDNLNSNLSAAVKSATLTTGTGNEKGPIFGAIGSALSNLSGFNAKAEIIGSLKEYDIRLTSDLDRVIKSAVGGIIKKQTAKFENDLKTAVLEKVGGPLGQLKADKSGFDAIGAQLTSRLNMGAGILGNLKRPF